MWVRVAVAQVPLLSETHVANTKERMHSDDKKKRQSIMAAKYQIDGSTGRVPNAYLI